MSVNWAELQPELVYTISNKLGVHVDYIRFRAVCSAWRAATCQTPSHLPIQLPWLMLPQSQSHHHTRRYFYRLLDDKFHSFNLPEASHRRRRCGSSHGWLVIVEESPSIFLINPLTRARHNLPPLTAFPNVVGFNFYNIGREYSLRSRDDEEIDGQVYFHNLIQMRDTFIKKVVLSHSPSQNANFIALAILNHTGDLAYCKNNVNSWKFIDNAQSFCEDVIYCNGLFYAVNKLGTVAVCDLNGDDEPKVSVIETLGPVSGDMMYLVNTKDDELLLIARDLELDVNVVGQYELDITYKTFEFCVYKMDRNKGSGPLWQRVDSLGDYVLFLGENASLALLASHYPGFKGNRIYFTDDYSEINYDGFSGDHDLGVYNMHDGSIEALACYPRNLHSRLRWPPPIWITPNPC